jgi:DNA modification methylase
MTNIRNTIIQGDCLEVMREWPDGCVNCCVASPPYWGLRDYGVSGQLGLEETPEEYVAKLVAVFREVRRALRDDGTLWLNLGDSYAGSGKGRNSDGITCMTGAKQASSLGSIEGKLKKTNAPGLKPKDLVGVPWRVAFALQADGWYLRQDIIWHKPNPMPESVRDRCTKAHEYIFLLSKSQKYHFDSESIKEDAVAPNVKHKSSKKTEEQESAYIGRAPTNLGRCGVGDDGKRNKRSVWTITTKPFKGAHFATFPPKLIEPCVLAGCPEGGIVLDPFMGAGTTAIVAATHGRDYIGIELNPEYVQLAKDRIDKLHSEDKK